MRFVFNVPSAEKSLNLKLSLDLLTLEEKCEINNKRNRMIVLQSKGLTQHNHKLLPISHLHHARQGKSVFLTHSKYQNLFILSRSFASQQESYTGYWFDMDSTPFLAQNRFILSFVYKIHYLYTRGNNSLE